MKPLREWKATCPCCDEVELYKEFDNVVVCPTLVCQKCNTEFIVSLQKFQCSNCSKIEECMSIPTITPLLHRSTWKALFQSRKVSKELLKRDWKYLLFLTPEEVLPTSTGGA